MSSGAWSTSSRRTWDAREGVTQLRNSLRFAAEKSLARTNAAREKHVHQRDGVAQLMCRCRWEVACRRHICRLVGGVEAVGLVGDKLDLRGTFWDTIGNLASNLGSLGYLIVGIFITSWGVAALIYRLKGFSALDAIDVHENTAPSETT